MGTEDYSEFEPRLNEVIFEDEIGNSRNKMIWSEIGHIVHSNRKPQYSLSSILRRTNLFDEQEFNQDEEFRGNETSGNIILKEIDELGKNDDYNGARKSKTLELLQVTDIIKNVHKEEVKIYLDEIAILRSQILQMSKNQMRQMEEQDIIEEEEEMNKREERDRIKNKVRKDNVSFDDKETNTSIELRLEILNSIEILPKITNNKFGSFLVNKIELQPESLRETTTQTLNNELLIEKNNYIQRLEDLNIEIQRQLDSRNEQFSSVSLELVKQKSLLARESENLKKSQQSTLDMENQLKQLLEKVSENEKYYLEQQESFNKEIILQNDMIQKLDSEKKTLCNFLEFLLQFTNYHIKNESILELNFSDFLENYSQDSMISESYPNLLEFIIIIDKILEPLKELLLKKNILLVDTETQTNLQPQIKPKLKIERISNIFIQSISNFLSQNYYEDTPITSNYITENLHKKDMSYKPINERNLEFVSNVSATRLRNEINILKNQLDASRQKLKLKDLENKKLSEEISYLKNKIIRNKTYNSSLSNQNFNYENNENYKLINNLKLNKLSRSKNYYSSLNYNKYSDENWDEIFSVIQQLKGP
ncbi:uncharacterized protein cubi_00042 [Cryptosporidium ubiquitum]|uniref:Uncharacterized protein n=1 Tax=Cryptosporidium ubiquitum TaxID=857276 RepID=A0A1J4MJS9_9CRYT|nr:uncharacterized protein cubi_00042 [Cryptosporidium ubiquitum]OII74489.1 hypothetical protein cubi_00042 [Cryptosporidium ubiquitum]